MRRLLALVLLAGLPAAVLAQTNVQPLPEWLRPAAPASSAAADPSGLGPGEPAPLPAPPPAVPVDGGLSLLALAGAGYAARRLRARRAA